MRLLKLLRYDRFKLIHHIELKHLLRDFDFFNHDFHESASAVSGERLHSL